MFKFACLAISFVMHVRRVRVRVYRYVVTISARVWHDKIYHNTLTHGEFIHKIYTVFFLLALFCFVFTVADIHFW